MLSLSKVHFTQSVQFARFQKAQGHVIRLFGVKHNNVVVATGIFKEIRIRIPFLDCYLGPTLDFEDDELLKVFVAGIKKHCKLARLSYATMSPYLIVNNYTQTGEHVESVNTEGYQKLKAMTQRGSNILPHFIFTKSLLDINNEDVLFKSYTSKARRDIRDAQKSCVEIVQIEFNDIPKLKAIMEQSALKQGFVDRALEFYECLYETFQDDVFTAKFLVSVIDTERLKANTEKLKANIHKKIEAEKSAGMKKELQNQLAGIQKKQNFIASLPNETLWTAAGVFIESKDEMVYLFGGNDQNYQQFHGIQAMLHHQLSQAVERRIPLFNFYGINNNFDKNSTEYNLLRYKQAFNGEVKELAGNFVIIANAKSYYFSRLAAGLRKIVKIIVKH